VIGTSVQAGPMIGRPATPADASRMIELLNSAHEREELYVPYTEETLVTRLTREPRLYSWPHLRVGHRAVVGVWPAHLNVIRTTGDTVDKQDRALVLDFGYEPGGEDELIELLRAERAALAAGGTTELTIFSCEPSTAHARLLALGKRIEPYVLSLYLPEPVDLASRGIYVDQLYF
jgi:hypothetical protein